MAKKNDKQVPVYFAPETYEEVKAAATKERTSLTKWIEEAVIARLKKPKK